MLFQTSLEGSPVSQMYASAWNVVYFPLSVVRINLVFYFWHQVEYYDKFS